MAIGAGLADHAIRAPARAAGEFLEIICFERVRVINSWVGHYDYNTLDYNAILGPHPDLPNFFFMNASFSAFLLSRPNTKSENIGPLSNMFSTFTFILYFC